MDADARTLAPQVDEQARRAAELLLREGCTEVFLFGSRARGDYRPGSDLDLAVRGCPTGQFFTLLGRLMMAMECPVDLVNLDRGGAFVEMLERRGELVKIG